MENGWHIEVSFDDSQKQVVAVATNNDQRITITGADFDELIASLKDAGVPSYESNWRELRFVLSKYL
ncbi:hypothetical protein [Pectobacterium polaris]|uniref:hypothetical protein n=1 Tax=Pectobacterium polaris TaxID=2042057 RepID=UPI0011C4624E|nr:hypothetical protein [Pectobacterium polaris]MCA6943304.1 hypothetical protein [Pectobacterium polaris]MCA6959027.1 hypothetical protein [Pectobacterium polaris]